MAPIVNWILFLTGAVNLTTGTWSLITGNTGIAGAGLTAGLLLLLASTIERFEVLKGMGLEAKTRVLDSKIIEADRAFEKLRVLAEISGATLIDLAAKTGRMGTALTAKESYILSRKIKENLEGLGCSQESINSALKPWAKITVFDISNKISQNLYNKLFEVERNLASERDRIPQPNVINLSSQPGLEQAYLGLEHSIAAAPSPLLLPNSAHLQP